MTFSKAMNLVYPFVTQIGENFCVAIRNAEGLLGSERCGRMLEDPRATEGLRPGFCRPGDVATFLLIKEIECEGR
jgi:hypothetical protein